MPMVIINNCVTYRFLSYRLKVIVKKIVEIKGVPI